LCGPNSKYVKLISNDGHEFIIKQELAKMSGNIRAILNDPVQIAENETNEIRFKEVP
jgi:transcription elongation factor B subunit 1